jgi:hypothetical protein
VAFKQLGRWILFRGGLGIVRLQIALHLRSVGGEAESLYLASHQLLTCTSVLLGFSAWWQNLKEDSSSNGGGALSDSETLLWLNKHAVVKAQLNSEISSYNMFLILRILTLHVLQA